MSGIAERRAWPAAVGAASVVAGGLLLLLVPVPAAGVEPTPGGATVDGSTAEWTPADDAFVLVGNDPPHRERGRVALRYDCDDEVLYALIMAGPDLRLEATDPDEAYLRLGSEPKLVSGTDEADGEAPDAAWVDLQGPTAAGIELGAPLPAGTYDDLRVHAKVPNDSEDGYETLDLSPRYQQLTITCAADAAAGLVAGADTGSGAGDPSDPAEVVDPAGLARTGAPVLPTLVGVGLVLIVGGAAIRLRRWSRPAGP